MSRRLYAQYRPTPVSLAAMQALQRQAQTVNPAARVVPESQIHLTIIHFGIMEEVFEQLRVVVPDLQRDQYQQSVARFVDQVEQSMPANLTTETISWDVYGFHRNTLVVTASVSDELHQAHADSLAAMRQCFTACRLPDPDSFMANNQNFQYALSLKPHITLLKNAPNLPPEALEPKIVHLQAMPILYD